MSEPTAVQQWHDLVDGRRTQMDAAYAALKRTSADFWSKRAGSYRRFAGVAAAEHPVIRRTLSLLPPGGSVIDVGAGTGRYTLALAPYAGRVTAVEPSPEMAAILREDSAAKQAGAVEILEEGWLESSARVDAADVVLCANVLYPHAEIEQWIESLEAKAKVALVLEMIADWDEPLVLLDLWQHFHGSRRILQPNYFDAYRVLHELGIPANVEIYPAASSRFFRFDDLDRAVEGVREHLILPESEAVNAVLRPALAAALRPDDGALVLPFARATATIWWRCDGPRLRRSG